MKKANKERSTPVENLESDVIELQNRVADCEEDLESLQTRMNDFERRLLPRQRRQRKRKPR